VTPSGGWRGSVGWRGGRATDTRSPHGELAHLVAISDPSTSRMFSVINTISVKLLVIVSPNPVPGATFHAYFDTHLICPNICLLIVNSQMCMALCNLEATFPIEFLKKGTASGYLMIVA